VLNTDANKNTNNNNSKEELEDPNSYYLILFRTFTIDKATSISIELANNAYLLTITSIEPTTETNPFNYNITTAALRYTSMVFIGIIINTSALKKFIASYG